jgi:chromosome segregation ATPase
VLQFQTAAKTIGAAMEFIKNPSREAFAAIGAAAKESAKAVADTFVNTARAVATNTGVVSKRTEEALAAREQMEQDHAARVEEIAQAQVDRLSAINKQRAEEAVGAMEEIAIAEENHAARAEELAQRRAKHAKEGAALEAKLQDELDRQREAAQKKQLADELAANDKKLQAAKDLAAKKVAEFIEEARAEKDARKDEQREADKAARLEAQAARGVRSRRPGNRRARLKKLAKKSAGSRNCLNSTNSAWRLKACGQICRNTTGSWTRCCNGLDRG